MQRTQTPSQAPSPASTPWQVPWPDGCTARYWAVAGATVDVLVRKDADHWPYDTKCTGCPYKDVFPSEDAAHRDAQRHAERCRALPRPTA
ncbi:hypothetical protein [Streptomyces sp. NPDC020298]|uniref:hypothetical protein n=1 Tax=unclassified Streptomyces TaxID=2593676 RepID=UPI0033D12030